MDVLHMQEIHSNCNTFAVCNIIALTFNLISNNTPRKYGTAMLISSSLPPNNIQYDSNGRIIVCDIPSLGFTTANVYLPSDSDSIARTGRENYCAETIPQFLLLR